jgi:oligopeptidase B
MTATIAPPVAAARPHTIQLHGETIADEYAWLQRRDDPEVLAYLEAENAYAEAAMADTAALQERLFAELRGRIKERDLSVPVAHGPFLYYTRTEEGQQYPSLWRRPAPDGPAQLLVDVNVLAVGRPFCRLGAAKPSPDHALLAYALDTTGGLVFTIYVKDLASGELLPVQIPNAAYSLEWGEDGRSLYYTTFDHAHRPHRLYRHTLGSDPSQDELLHEEPNERLTLYLNKTRSGAFLTLRLWSHDGAEVRFKPAADPLAPFATLDPLRKGVEYDLDHHGDQFLIRTNAGAENFRLVAAPVADPAQRRDLIAPRPDVLIDSVDVFADYLVVWERRGGLQQIRIARPDGGDAFYVEFPEPVYSLGRAENPEFASDVLRFSYSSLVTPKSVIDYHMGERRWELRKQDEIPSGYDPSLYASERLEAVAPDGARVPLSLVYRRGLVRDGSAPALLYGYGAYGYSYDPGFDARRLSLLDRGFVVAIGHVRGGSELGRPWYEQGRLLHKQNSFSDFIACAEQLIAQGYSSPDRLAISGTSAGGLLVSAAVNARPELFAAVLARVPFTNVIAAMIDKDLPLTVIEWDQWGDPAVEEQWRAMRSYDPYEHVAAKEYPPIMATGGLHDLQVPYWDPAKWVARLRARKTDNNLLILRTNMRAGHGGASGRFDNLRETAFEFAFILKALGRAESQ